MYFSFFFLFFLKKVKWKDQDGRRSSNTVLGSEKFAVKKLNKLWQAALSGTFTEYQLKSRFFNPKMAAES